MQYTFVLVILFVIELLYFKIANRYNIIDKPNHRSSHILYTIRGGGILFPLAVLIAFFLGHVSWAITAAILLVGIISFIDDIRSLSQLVRFGSQVLAFLLVGYDLNLFTETLWVLPIVLVLFIGWINAFNFMDGINGITVLYAISSILSFSILPFNQRSLPLLTIMGLACVVFGFFNIRSKAKTFAGDVGSISMALFLGYFMIKTILYSGQMGYILFFALYGIDAVITIINRIRKRENIFDPHRSHLYQYLANECGYSHIIIAMIYAVTQLLINIFVIYLERIGGLQLFSIFSILISLTLVYLMVRTFVFQKVVLKKQLN
jgi:UDP-N-acetylmuramyl pentapeptide phosphotransferase/UDP-N-acetylglucosamine-1-phosphate transferase